MEKIPPAYPVLLPASSPTARFTGGRGWHSASIHPPWLSCPRLCLTSTFLLPSQQMVPPPRRLFLHRFWVHAPHLAPRPQLAPVFCACHVSTTFSHPLSPCRAPSLTTSNTHQESRTYPSSKPSFLSAEELGRAGPAWCRHTRGFQLDARVGSRRGPVDLQRIMPGPRATAPHVAACPGSAAP